ncbi:acyl-CoA dehydrogenase family protein [Flectobacillus longus]|uniref:acyl-CoA dehydrogenase family protein n=1 Tax=Flectobacillus longus TaxID=2984207 RepID=UPI0024B65A58|nr:acyl-CoA dehydrogenase family protein [Flectobacillus longus]MDI9880985.1 acyl-CoA dehydrogenase family protein [Flectobacillus longus]
MNFSHSPKTLDLIQKVEYFVHKHILPIEEKFRAEPLISNPNFQEWSLDEEIESLKKLAKSQGLWNLFLPEISGLSNVEYAPLAEAMGYSLLAPEVFNCNAPDTGNMEVLWKYGTTEQKEKWLTPLLEGSIRSVFCMTEPAVASSDATNMKATIEGKGDYLLINGTKWWSTGIGHPNCKIAIFMGLSNPEEAKHAQHSMVFIPLDTEGVSIKRMLPVFGTYDPPYGHGEVSFENVKVPKSNLIGGLGKGFEIAQGRLGPGRIHHCMRVLGASERALRLMIERGKSRTAFGKSLIELGGNTDIIANARMEIDMARLLVMKTAFLLDTYGIKGALSEVSQIKVVAPTVACKIIDQAMQLFGGKGLSNDTPLAGLYAYARTLRLADGPDEVHRNVVAKLELKKYRES